jgi:hypothetical protein
MYNNWDDLRVGWTKNLALLFRDARELARKRSQEFHRLLSLLLIAPWATSYYLSHPGASRAWFWTVMIGLVWFFTFSSLAAFYARVARAHFPFGPTLLSIAGLPLFAALLRKSARAHEQGTVAWRGRVYNTARSGGRAVASNCDYNSK